ncbi:MAG TPA: hypothetical protein VF541_11830 [Longimicrobium sp.]
MTRLHPAWSIILAAAWLSSPAALASQRRDTSVVAGRRYEAGGLHQALFGATYRDLWTAPVSVPLLDLATYAGGLTPTERGGGNQTLSLRFRGADGREYAFRSVDKDQTQTLHRDLQGTVVSRIVQDQISSLVPAAGVAAHRVEAAAGVPYTTEQLFVMPDDPRLGEFRSDFAGKLGTLEERPAAGHTGVAELAGADRLLETKEFLDSLQSGPGERFDDRGYLAVRLVDILLGDWDRHAGQYRWARLPAAGGGHLWRVLPRDRDYAFVDYDGLFLGAAHHAIPNSVRYRRRIDLLPMLVNASQLDRRLLGAVPRAAWDSVTAAVQARLTDAALDAAVAAMPPEWRQREGDRIAATLKARRDDLARVSTNFYRIIAREAEAHGTDVADEAVVEREPDGNASVTITSGGTPVYRRWFNWVETREVRVYLHAGPDVARVTGSGPEQVIVRVIGGPGDDDLRDEGRAGHRTAFYDSEGSNRYARRAHTRVDERAWETALWEPGGGSLPPRDWGASAAAFAPTFGWRPAGVGPYVGVGPSWTRYGFRRTPYAVKQRVRFMWAVEHTRFGAEYVGDFRYVGRPMDMTLLLARVSDMEASRFPGFGNDTEIAGRSSDELQVFEHQLMGNAAFWRGVGRQAWAMVEVTGRFTDPEPRAGTPAGDDRPRGSGDFAVVGGRAGLVFDRVDSTAYPRRGWRVQTFGTGFPLAFHDAEAFGRAHAVGITYLSAGSGGPTLALRAGGERVWGGFPFQYSAFLGGGATIRGYRSQRYAGDASAFGSAEVRQVLTRAKLLVRGELGVLALGDAGRVWYRGASPDGWHTAYGGGVFFTFLGRRRAVSATYAHGERNSVYFSFGLPF